MNKTIENALGYVKKHAVAVIAYSIAVIAIFITAMCMLSWALEGAAEQTVAVKSAALVAIDRNNPPSLKEEYIVGQEFDTHGWALEFDGKAVMLNADDIYEKYVQNELDKRDDLVPGSEEYAKLAEKLTALGSKYDKAIKELDKVSVTTEFNAAYENKRVRFVYKKSDYVSYAAEVKGRVLYVRAVEVGRYPEFVNMTGGAPVIGEDFEVYAVLGNKPQTDAFGEYEEVRGGWRIKLGRNMYTLSAVTDDALENFYTLTLVCGDVSTEFSFYNAAGRSFVVGSKNNVVEYETDAAGKALTLVVTQRDDGYQLNCKGKSSGSYIYTDGNVSAVYDFEYELDGTNENFRSDAAVSESRTQTAYAATVDGTVFSAQADVWQGAVVNGLIVDDHGFKMVIGSEKRILEFEYLKPFIELTGETEAWDADGGVTVSPNSLGIVCKDNGAWTLTAEYVASNEPDKVSAITVDGNNWKFDGSDVILVVPDFEKSKLAGATEVRIEQTVTGGKALYSATVKIAFTYKNNADANNPIVSEREISFVGEHNAEVTAELYGETAFDAQTDLPSSDGGAEQTLGAKMIVNSDLTWRLYAGTDGNEAAVADGYWYYEKGAMKLSVAHDENDVIYTPDIDDGEVKTLTVKRAATRGSYTYSLDVNYAYRADAVQSPQYLKLSLDGRNDTVALPSLTLYVSEYSMNPLLGTGNGYSRGVYVYTDANGNSYNLTFYLQAWVWTYVPLSSSHGDVYAEASVNDYVKDNDGNWNSFRRGVMYADITFFDRGNGFTTVNFFAVEEKWLNALLNL